jgi:hypothetical protein
MSDDEILDQVTPEVPAQAPAQVTMTQEQIDKIVKSRIARERERWEASQQAPHMPSGTGASLEAVKQMMQAEMAKLKEEAERTAQDGARRANAQRIVADYQTKMEQGKAKYPDFDEVVGKSRVAANPKIVQLVTNVDNTADVVYELAQKKGKVGAIISLYNEDPALGMEAIVELSESIKANQKAATTGKPYEPLSRVSSSSTTTDASAPDIRDYMKQDWLRR